MTVDLGRTAEGRRIRRFVAVKGRRAAATSGYPVGKGRRVPGDGKGTVEDVGSASKGDHIDVFFKGHKDAERWGVRTLKVTVWVPQ